MISQQSVFIALACLYRLSTVHGRSDYRDRIPNGNNVYVDGSAWPGVGHTRREGGGNRNAFGADFAAEGNAWTPALCQKDSDGDGKTNGAELGDPNCVWKQGEIPQYTTGISHPGFCDEDLALVSKQNDTCNGYNYHPNHEKVRFRFPKHTIEAKETQYIKMPFKWTDMGLSSDGQYSITRFNIHVDNQLTVHHMLLYGCQSQQDVQDYIDLGKPGDLGSMPCQQIQFAWAVGGKDFCLPDRVAQLIDPDKMPYFMLEIHYNNPQLLSGITDSSGIDLIVQRTTDLSKDVSPSAFAILGSTLNGLGPLQPGKKLISVQVTYDLNLGPSEINVFASMAHAHGYGRKIWMELYRDGKYEYDVACNDNYDYDLQELVPSDGVIKIRGNDKLIVRCEYDTTNATKPIQGGDATADEMCILALMYYPIAPQISVNLLKPTYPTVAASTKKCNAVGSESSLCLASSALSQEPPKWMQTHAFLMIVAWCLFLPVGILVSMLYRSILKSSWIRVHITLQLAGLALAIAGFAIAVNNVKDHFSGENIVHKTIGLIVMIVAIAQPINGFARPHLPQSSDADISRKRAIWETYHKNAGRLAGVLAIANCFLGITAYQVYDDADATTTVWITLGALLGITTCILVGGLIVYSRRSLDNINSVNRIDAQMQSNFTYGKKEEVHEVKEAVLKL